MNKIVLAGCASLLLFLCCIAPQSSIHLNAQDDCTLYLAPNGDDSAAGDMEHPWKTIQFAADSAQAGDVVCLLAGDYPAEDGVFFTVSGTADAPITFTAPEGATVHRELTLQSGTSHLRLDGFTVTDFVNWGISLDGDNQDVILSNLEVYGGEAGIHFTVGDSGQPPEYGPVDSISVLDSVIYDTEYTAVDCTPGPCNNLVFRGLEIYGAGMVGEASFGADGLAVERGENILVEDCYVHDVGGDGIDLNSRDAMLESDSGEVVVQNNTVTGHLRNGIKLWRGGLATNNLVWNGGEENLVLVTGGSYQIINNTFLNRTSHGYLALLGDEVAPGETTILMVNNIFWNDNPEMGGTLIYFAQGVQFETDYNLYYNPYREDEVICTGDDLCASSDAINDGTWFAETGQGEHSLYADPLFVDPAEGDFHLQEGSPAMGNGSPDYAPDMGVDWSAIETE